MTIICLSFFATVDFVNNYLDVMKMFFVCFSYAAARLFLSRLKKLFLELQGAMTQIKEERASQ